MHESVTLSRQKQKHFDMYRPENNSVILRTVTAREQKV